MIYYRLLSYSYKPLVKSREYAVSIFVNMPFARSNETGQIISITEADNSLNGKPNINIKRGTSLLKASKNITYRLASEEKLLDFKVGGSWRATLSLFLTY